MNLQIQTVAIDDIKEFENNPRTHSPKQIDNLCKSISKFGFVNPIIVNRNTNSIIAGHGRLAAAKKLKMTSVPVVYLEHLTEKQVRELIVADNALTDQGAWDKDLLAEVLSGLDDLEYLELPTLDDDPEPEDDAAPVQKELLQCPECGHVNEAKAFKKYENSDESL